MAAQEPFKLADQRSRLATGSVASPVWCWQPDGHYLRELQQAAAGQLGDGISVQACSRDGVGAHLRTGPACYAVRHRSETPAWCVEPHDLPVAGRRPAEDLDGLDPFGPSRFDSRLGLRLRVRTRASAPNVPAPRIQVVTADLRRRRFSTAQSIRLVEQSMQPGTSASLVVRQAGFPPSMRFNRRRRMRLYCRTLCAGR
jgi:hypothetical protein